MSKEDSLGREFAKQAEYLDEYTAEFASAVEKYFDDPCSKGLTKIQRAYQELKPVLKALDKVDAKMQKYYKGTIA